MRLGAVLLAGAAEADVGADANERRATALGDRGVDRGRERGEIVAVVDLRGVPAVGLEAKRHVLRERERGRAVDGDLVGVVEDDQLAEAEVARERARLGGDSLHQIAVGRDHERAVIEEVEAGAIEVRGQHALGDRHPDRVGEALTERSGGGLDARREPVLGMAGRARAELAEAAQLVEREVEAGEVEETVEERRGVAGREHEAVAIEPVGRGRVETQGARPELVGERAPAPSARRGGPTRPARPCRPPGSGAC